MKGITAHQMRYSIAAILLVILFCVAATAHCAVWVPFNFTAPDDVPGLPGEYVSGVGRYRMEFQNGAVWDSVRIYASPGVEGVAPQPAGQLVTFYVSQSVQPLTSRTYRIVAIDNRGNRAGASNLVVIATGFPDTIAALSRPARGIGLGFQRTSIQPAKWKLELGDSADVHAVHQEEIQLAVRSRLCVLFGHWALRGAQQTCP